MKQWITTLCAGAPFALGVFGVATARPLEGVDAALRDCTFDSTPSEYTRCVNEGITEQY